MSSQSQQLVHLSPEPFVLEWDVVQTLGEGAFGEVHLLVHRTTQQCAACKVIDLGVAGAEQAVKKEIACLRMLDHENCVRFIGHRVESGVRHEMFIFLEYAAGGDLFDRIEPDVGMAEAVAHRYFRQLIAGVEYMHQRGVTHRDLKPENLLLDENDILKISDFGMATMFRNKLGVHRKLSQKCGTLPYTAPEVIVRDYDAEPADIWSTGVILVAMLTGELPWESPREGVIAYDRWKEQVKELMEVAPWKKIEPLAFSLLRTVLHPKPELRATIVRIKENHWFQKNFSRDLKRAHSGFDTDCISAKRMRDCTEQDSYFLAARSQPVAQSNVSPVKTQLEKRLRIKQEHGHFSQPLNAEGNFIASDSPYQPHKLHTRMTRFIVALTLREAENLITEACRAVGLPCKRQDTQLRIETHDNMKLPLRIKISLLRMNGRTLVDFCRAKGDGLEFKRLFKRLSEIMQEKTRLETMQFYWATLFPIRALSSDL